MSLYEVLGVDRDADHKTIKAAYRRRAKTAHPDAGGDPAAFEELRMAFDVLSDPALREHYDATGEIGTKEPDNETAQAVGILATVFGAVLTELAGQNREPVKADLVRLMRVQLGTGMTNADRDLAQTKKALARWLAMSGRFTTKEGAPNRFAPIIAAKVAELERLVASIENVRALTQRALDMLDEHEFRFDDAEPAPPSVMSGYGIGLGSFFNTAAA